MTLATAAGWVGTSAWRPSEVKSWVTVISFLVRVPVLSEQMTLQQPEEGNGVTSNQCGPPGHVTGGEAGGRRGLTQRLHDGQPLHDGPLLHHPHHAQRQRHRHHDGKPLWDGSHSQAGRDTQGGG